MIYSYGARNYYSFREGMDVSFKLSNKVPSNFSQGRKAATVLGIKGANASGKTNILKCLEFLAQFITESFSFDEGEYIGFDTYFDNGLPSDFYIDFELGGVKYFYELTATPDEVISEVLYKRLQRKTLVFERKGLSIVDRPSELVALDLIELKPNASVISTVVKYKIKELHDIFLPVYEYFDNVTGNVARTSVVPDERMFKQGSSSSFYYKNSVAFSFAKEIIKKSDLGIIDIVIHKNELAAGKTEYFPLFLHKVGNTDQTHYLNAYQQSSGTMALFRRLAMYWIVLNDGGVLVMDEFDQNCHPMLLPLLLELFTDKKINRNNAQFIFTAHNSDIIDDLGKYRTILVSKKNGESYCFRLDDIPGDLIRNDRSISALYREGKIGGIPIL